MQKLASNLIRQAKSLANILTILNHIKGEN